MFRLLHLFKTVTVQHPFHSLFFFLGVTFVGLMQTISLGSLYPIINSLMAQNKGADILTAYFDRILFTLELVPGLTNYLILFLSVSFVSATAFILLQIYQALFLRNLEFNVRSSLMQNVVSSQWHALRDLNHGDFINAVTHEAEGYKGLVKYCFMMLSEVVQAAFLVYLAFIIDSKIVLLSMALFLASSVLFYPLMQKASSLGHAWSKAFSLLTDGLVNVARAFKSIKAGSAESLVMKYLNDRIYTVCHEYYKQQVLSAVQTKLTELVGYIILCAIIFYYIRLQGGRLADVTLILVVFTRLVPKMKSIIDNFHVAYGSLPSLDRINSIKDSCEAQTVEGTPLDTELKAIVLDSVGFGYAGDKPLFEAPLSVTMHKGEFWAICGPTGSGKTTILDMLSGIIRPSSGTIYYNGIPHDAIDISTLHRRVSYITQDNFIFAGTILENILWGNERPDMSRLDKAVSVAQLEVMLREKKIDSGISESGQNLSGGQRQRIAIARALMRESDFIFMDEPTSSLDAETEGNFIEALKELKGKVGIVMVTHRQHNIKHFDHVLMVEGSAECQRFDNR